MSIRHGLARSGKILSCENPTARRHYDGPARPARFLKPLDGVTARKAADDLRRDAKVAARQAVELRQTAEGLLKRAVALERLSEALLRRAARVRRRT
jgi:hypothetical protein